MSSPVWYAKPKTLRSPEIVWPPRLGPGIGGMEPPGADEAAEGADEAAPGVPVLAWAVRGSLPLATTPCVPTAPAPRATTARRANRSLDGRDMSAPLGLDMATAVASISEPGAHTVQPTEAEAAS